MIQDLLCWTGKVLSYHSLPQEGLGGERVEALSLDLDDEAAAEGGGVGFKTGGFERLAVYGSRFFLFWPAGAGFAVS